MRKNVSTILQFYFNELYSFMQYHSTMKANIGPKIDSRLERSPQGDDGTYLFKEVIITHFWAAGLRCITEVGGDASKSEGMMQWLATLGPWFLVTSMVKCTAQLHVVQAEVKKLRSQLEIHWRSLLPKLTTKCDSRQINSSWNGSHKPMRCFGKTKNQTTIHYWSIITRDVLAIDWLVATLVHHHKSWQPLPRGRLRSWVHL